jgi:ubiquinone/menaquinone biosynthesis C-methylase UbiE
MMENMPKNVFNLDVAENQGYRYTTNASLSSFLANRRLTDLTLETVSVNDKSVLDIGCGDGAYTLEIASRGKPELMIAGDVADEAIKKARRNAVGQKVHFMVNSAYQLPFRTKAFEVAILRGVLHHLDHPEQAIQEALRVAHMIFVIEPNGYNPGLKLLEKFSAYHIEHEEKSYGAHALDQWVRQGGGQVVFRKWAGFVPFFSPDWLARLMKWMEPFIENAPLIDRVASAVYTFCAVSNR